MLRPGLKWVTISFLLLLSLMTATVLYAQTNTPDDQPEVSDNGTEVVEESGDIELPSDLTLREDFQTEDENQPQMTLGWQDYLKTFVSLAIVLVVIWGISVLFKRFVTVRGLATTTESLKILYTMSLSPTRTLYLIRLGDRILLIGAGDGGMRTLAEISDTEEVAAIVRDIEFKGNFDMNPFRDRLQSLVGEEDIPQPSTAEFKDRQRKLKDAMEKLKNSSGN